MRYTLFLIVILLFSCGSERSSESVGDKVSNDLSRLNKLIDVSKFTPREALFVYDTNGNVNSAVPGPTDHSLEAVMYFDSIGFYNLSKATMSTKIITADHKQVYMFDWMDDDLKKELNATDSIWVEMPAHFFAKGSLIHGGFLMLDKKILLRLYTM